MHEIELLKLWQQVKDHFAEAICGLYPSTESVLCTCTLNAHWPTYHISLKFRSSEILFQGPVWCGNDLRVARFEGGIYRDRHACAYAASIISLLVCMYNVRSRLGRSVELLYKPSYSVLVGWRRQSSNQSCSWGRWNINTDRPQLQLHRVLHSRGIRSLYYNSTK